MEQSLTGQKLKMHQKEPAKCCSQQVQTTAQRAIQKNHWPVSSGIYTVMAVFVYKGMHKIPRKCKGTQFVVINCDATTSVMPTDQIPSMPGQSSYITANRGCLEGQQ